MKGCSNFKSFKDPVHGYVDVCGELVPLVDSPVFQRLRGIRQTGFAYYVYHGMEHSRFNHSLGVAHLAREVIPFIAANTRLYYGSVGGHALAEALESTSLVFQAAALIHDIGHLPFSHASEAGISDGQLVFGAKSLESLPPRHEAYTLCLASHVAGLVEKVEPVLTTSLEGDLKLILGGEAGEATLEYIASCAASILNQLLAGGIDIDRMDYLHRDSLYAGVSYGLFDVDRLIRLLVASPILQKGSSRLEVDPLSCRVLVLDKGLSIVESFLLARFYMFSEVYLHRVVETYNSLYARLLALLGAEGVVGDLDYGVVLPIPRPEKIREGDEEALKAWIALDGNQVIGLIRSVAWGSIELRDYRGEARRLAEMILGRRHPKLLHAVDDRRLWASYKVFLETGGSPLPSRITSILRELVELQREDPLLIVRPLRVDLEAIKNISIYDRGIQGIREIRLEGKEENPLEERIRKLAEIGVYRVIAIAPKGHEKQLARARELLEEARKAARAL
ncbi:MAG: HD domain-containing protein [Pyrodictiaceae archaeon]